jgi:glucokinase
MAWIGIDLGGTKIQGVVLREEEVVAEARRKTPLHGGPLAVVDAIAALVGELAGPGEVDGLGIGLPGVVDPKEGTVRHAPNLPGWMEPFGVSSALSESLGGLRVEIDNDVNVAVVAEQRLGAGRGHDDLLGVFVGTGVGGGVVLGGALRRGPSGAAGEIGHTVVRRGGRACGCGGKGHLEAYAGRASMERRARELEAKGRDTLLVELAQAKRMTSGIFAKALAQKDAVAVELIDDAVAALGAAIASAVTLMDFPLVVIGGGLADRLGPAFVERVEQAVQRELFPANPALMVVPGELGDRGGAIGAAVMAADRVHTP